MIGALRQAESEVVEALTDASDHLAFAEKLAAAAKLPAEVDAEVAAQIAGVRDRLVDQRLRLAVIGEFSTGKTTFINALLRQPLFPVSVMPTTAAAVWVEHGTELALRVTFRGSAEVYDTRGSEGAASFASLAIRLQQIAGQQLGSDPLSSPQPAGTQLGSQSLSSTQPGTTQPGSTQPGSTQPGSTHAAGTQAGGTQRGALGEVLALLTSRDEVASQVESLRVWVPAASLASGLTIIDCPGSNASVSHTEIARKVVAEADLAIVLVSAIEPVPMSLAEFLTEAFDARVLSRCAFIATRMDGIVPHEQPALLATIKDRLAQQLELIDPQVEPAAAHTVLLNASGRQLSDVETYWLDRFLHTEDWLTKLMLKQRVASVSDSILRLLDALLGRIREHLQIRVAELTSSRELLAANRIRDMDAFLVEQATAADRRVDPVINKVRWDAQHGLPGGIPAVIAACDTLLDAANNTDSLKKAVDGPIREAIQSGVAEWLSWAYATAAPQLAHAVQTAQYHVDLAFHTEYSRLGSTIGRQNSNTAPVFDAGALVRLVTGEMSGVVATTAKGISENNKRTGWGVGAGVAIGAVILGPVGAVAGAFIGGMLASNVKQAREKIRPAVHTAVQQAFEQTTAAAVEALWEAGIRCKAALSAHLGAYRTTYERSVQAILAEQDRQEQLLSADRDAIAESAVEAGRRRERIQSQRDRVAALGAR
jgi:GTPase SAR1 family protein